MNDPSITPALLDKGAEALDSKMNIHYLNDRVCKLESLVTVSLLKMLEKHPNDYKEVLPEFAKLFLHQQTIYDDSDELQSKAF